MTEKMRKWTPGPWTVDGGPMNRIVWSDEDNRVCFMAHSNGRDDERDIATSNLIAAAPDLAEAARIAIQLASIASDWNLDEVEIDGEMRSIYDVKDIFCDAFAKARGES